MALISCPECGKSNISDTAECCPECGYSIREHFAREKRKNAVAEEKRLWEEKRQNEWKLLEVELNKELEKIDQMKPMVEPIQPSFLKCLFNREGVSLLVRGLIIAAVLLGLGFFLKVFIYLFAILIVLGIPYLLYITYAEYDVAVQHYKNEYEEWKEQQKDWNRYIAKRKWQIRNEYEQIATSKATYGTRSAPVADIPIERIQLQCPICGTADVERITTMDRSFSIAMVGLASGKIGKQYRCKKCKHMW